MARQVPQPQSPPPPESAAAAAAAVAELAAVVDRLRDPDGGCPWDLEQTHGSLVPYLLEEAHEVADAIRHGEDAHLQEELGDLLLQVVLHCRIAAEEGRFDLADVARGIGDKLVRRHPHVFDPAQAGGAGNRGRRGDVEAVRRSWEAIKAAERPDRHGPAAASPLTAALRRRVRGQPALAAAMTISRRAAAAGFEWDDLDGVWRKVHEELEELRQAVRDGDSAHAETELGDVLFTLVNVARWCRISPEEGLAGTNSRFLARFGRVEAALEGRLEGRSLAELEALWQQAKAEIAAGMAAGTAADDS
jgi:XTP/dITP diphosphohydrolase